MEIINKISKENRLLVIKFLFNLGLSKEIIARAIGWSQQVVHQLIEGMGGTKVFPERPTRQKEVFQNILKLLVRRTINYKEWSKELFEVLPADEVILAIERAIFLIIPLNRLYLILRGSLRTCFVFAALVVPKSTPDRFFRALFGDRKWDFLCYISGTKHSERRWDFEKDEIKNFLKNFLSEEDNYKECASFDDLIDVLVTSFPKHWLSSKFIQQFERVWPVKAEDFLSALSEIEQKIVRMYYGFEQEELTLEEIGEKMGLTRERVRQIKEKAIRRMRHSEIFGTVILPSLSDEE